MYLLCFAILLSIGWKGGEKQYWVAAAVRRYPTNESPHVPCSFLQSVNVTDDPKLDNGSYIHDGILIPSNWIGTYNYVFTRTMTTVKVKPHSRGCICSVKACINICCPMNSMYSNDSMECSNLAANSQLTFKLNVTLGNVSLSELRISEHFILLNVQPCKEMYLLKPEDYPSDSWQLLENGSLWRQYDNEVLGINKYCFVPKIDRQTINNNNLYSLKPVICRSNNTPTTVRIINTYAMLFSIPFMLLTIMVYLMIPELRNQHGKSLVCYLIGLTVGYSMLCCHSLVADVNVWSTSCKVVGYTAYYSFMAAFLWLNVISFDLWYNFRISRNINRNQERHRFTIYSLYSWGTALIFLIFTWYAQELSNWPNYLKPEIGQDYCWLNMSTWSPLIYFFGPIMLMIVTNLIMFIMTAMKIHAVQGELKKITSHNNNQTHSLRNEKDRFGLFLRLFVVMGVTWLMEIISYFVGTEVYWSKIFYVSDLCNAIQGFLIFILFVMKAKVRKLFLNRFVFCKKTTLQQSQSQCSNKTLATTILPSTVANSVNASTTNTSCSNCTTNCGSSIQTIPATTGTRERF